MDLYTYSPSPESAFSSPLNPNVLFPAPSINHVAVAVAADGTTSVEVASTPQEVQTRNKHEKTTINEQQSHKRKVRVSMSEPTDSLEKDTFDYTRNGLPRKNASRKAGQMAKSRQITKIQNAILDCSLNQSQ
jgi:hypothetical protein